MIDKEVARNLIPLVNTHEAYEALVEYAAYRYAQNNKTMNNSSDINEILRIQGQNRELSRIINLRDEVLSDSE